MIFSTFTIDKILTNARLAIEAQQEKKEQDRKTKEKEFAKQMGFSRTPSMTRRVTGYAFA